MARLQPPPEVPHGPDPWRVVEDEYRPERAAYYATLFTIGNGWFGTRGTFEETTTGAGFDRGLPATYLAGFFDDRPGEVTEIANGPNWLPLRFEIDGIPLTPEDAGPAVTRYRRELDLRRGMLTREFTVAVPGGRRCEVRLERFASLATPWLSAIRAHVTVHGGDARVRWVSEIDGATENDGYPHYVPVTARAASERGGSGGPLLLRLETRESRRTVTVASAADAAVGSRRRRRRESTARGAVVGESGEARVRAGETLRLVKWVTWATSTEGIEEFDGTALERLTAARRAGWDRAVRAHEKAWSRFWDDVDVEVDGDPFLQKASRFSAYHLRITLPEGDPRVSVAAKTLSGPGYLGHVFWDTELFIFPFFLWTQPDFARRLLMYRYLGLEGARRKARSLGCEGAAYPWEAADTGDEVCPVWLGSRLPEHRIPCRNGVQQLHVTGAVAYAWDQYERVTGDRDLLDGPGIEVLAETARFWATRATHVPARSRYEFRDVVGPDEFHEGVANNHYTNALARWNISEALARLEALRERDRERFLGLTGRIGLDAKDLWYLRHVGERIHLRGPDRSGLIEQFDGYLALEDVADRAAWERAGESEPFWSRVQGTQYLKQPDVVMNQWLFPDGHSRRVLARNFSYYLGRTLHGSSLSLCIHAIQGARLGRAREGLELLRRAAGIDLANVMGNSDAGIHAAAAGGVWMGLVLGLGGLRAGTEGVLRMDPAVAAPIERVAFRVRWRGALLRVEVRPRGWAIASIGGRRGRATTIEIAGRRHTLKPGGEIRGRTGT